MNLEAIFDLWYDRIYGFALLRVGCTYDAQDISSEVFVRVAQSISRFNPEKASFSTWLHTIALNEVKRHYSRNTQGILPFDQLEHMPADGEISDGVIADERTRAIAAVLARLDERQREMVILRYYREMGNREIAAVMGTSESNVGTILARARKNLKKLLETCDEINFDGYNLVETRKEVGVK